MYRLLLKWALTCPVAAIAGIVKVHGSKELGSTCGQGITISRTHAAGGGAAAAAATAAALLRLLLQLLQLLPGFTVRVLHTCVQPGKHHSGLPNEAGWLPDDHAGSLNNSPGDNNKLQRSS